MAYRTDAHDHHDDGAVHAHVSSSLFYGGVFVALVMLTIATVGQSYFDFGRASLAIVILIASAKASLVVTFFMHLKWDNKFNALIFICGLAFIGVFFAYTFNDVDKRGELDPDQNVIVWQKTGQNAPGHFDQLQVHEPAPGASGSAAPAGSHAPATGGGAGEHH
jgi:cytochrome c oxidase subunit 4